MAMFGASHQREAARLGSSRGASPLLSPRLVRSVPLAWRQYKNYYQQPNYYQQGDDYYHAGDKEDSRSSAPSPH
jgi:hypothetical protein